MTFPTTLCRPGVRSRASSSPLGRVLAGVLLGVGLLGPSAVAQSPVDQVNAPYLAIPEANRSDLILLPALADMEPAPVGAQAPQQAMLLPAGSTNWSRTEAWATAEPQVAVLAALDRITQETDYRRAMVFAQPYGPSVPRPLIAAGLYTELGDPPTLAAAHFGYMRPLDDMACLVHVEATRRLDAGDPAGAIDVLTDWAFFARQMADRALFDEAVFGYRQMIDAMERIRDIAFLDMRGDRALTLQQIQDAIARLAENGILGIERLALPRGEMTSTAQLTARVFGRDGLLNAGAFSSAMAAAGASGRPLRLFSEAARWSGAADAHTSQAVTARRTEQVFDDWTARWNLDPFDARHNTPSVFQRDVDGQPLYAVIDAALDDMGQLIPMRQQLRTEAVGTRAALGLVGYAYQTRQFPPTLAAIRPRWVRELEADPYNGDRRVDRRPPLAYFVPVRDTQARGPGLHEMNVVARDSNFVLRLGQDQFVLYSVGPDQERGWAAFVSNDPDAVRGDYLIWPPVISLLRIDLEQQGLLN